MVKRTLKGGSSNASSNNKSSSVKSRSSSVKKTSGMVIPAEEKKTSKPRRTRHTRSFSPRRTSRPSSEASREKTVARMKTMRNCKGLKKSDCKNRVGCEFVGPHVNAEGNNVKGKCYDQLGRKIKIARAARKAVTKKTRTRRNSCEKATRRSQCKEDGCVWVQGYTTTGVTRTGKPKQVKAKCYKADSAEYRAAVAKKQKEQKPPTKKATRTRHACEKNNKKNCGKGCRWVEGYRKNDGKPVKGKCYAKKSSRLQAAKDKRLKDRKRSKSPADQSSSS